MQVLQVLPPKKNVCTKCTSSVERGAAVPYRLLGSEEHPLHWNLVLDLGALAADGADNKSACVQCVQCSDEF